MVWERIGIGPGRDREETGIGLGSEPGYRNWGKKWFGKGPGHRKKLRKDWDKTGKR